MDTLLERITVNPQQCGGRPCVRGMRIRVSDVLDLFASGLDAAQILDKMPDLESEDLKACLTYETALIAEVDSSEEALTQVRQAIPHLTNEGNYRDVSEKIAFQTALSEAEEDIAEGRLVSNEQMKARILGFRS